MGKKRKAHGQRGIWKPKATTDDPDVKVADFSYQSDKLAEIITLAWINNGNYAGQLTDHTTNFAKTELENRAGIKLKNPVVLTEDEYNDGWQMVGDDEVIFVLPDVSRVKKTAADTSASLLETAKMLMACVPNGI
ncbi:MAG TPA: hypothetical protein VLU23_10230 [Pseudolabrys sp.]|nr:hypothetical protein [Pseudolabrys sp.]